MQDKNVNEKYLWYNAHNQIQTTLIINQLKHKYYLKMRSKQY